MEKSPAFAKAIDDLMRENADCFAFLMQCVEQEIHATQERHQDKAREQDAEHARKMGALSDCLSEKAEELVTLYEKKVYFLSSSLAKVIHFFSDSLFPGRGRPRDGAAEGRKGAISQGEGRKEASREVFGGQVGESASRNAADAGRGGRKRASGEGRESQGGSVGGMPDANGGGKPGEWPGLARSFDIWRKEDVFGWAAMYLITPIPCLPSRHCEMKSNATSPSNPMR